MQPEDSVDRVCYDEFGGKVYVITLSRKYFEVTLDRKTLAVTVTNPLMQNIQEHDLSGSILPEQEMVNMILGQRAYEANSKVVRTADEMLQQVNNLAR